MELNKLQINLNNLNQTKNNLNSKLNVHRSIIEKYFKQLIKIKNTQIDKIRSQQPNKMLCYRNYIFEQKLN